MSKTIPVLLFAMCIAVGVASTRYLQAADPVPATKPSEAPKAENTKCLVTGEDIDPKVTVTYKGKTYAFCCSDCVKKFNDNPEKYIDK